MPTYFHRYYLVITLLLIATSGCAPTSQFPDIDPNLAQEEARKQRIEAAKENHFQIARLNNIQFQILGANVELCSDKVKYMSGLIGYTSAQLDKEWREPMEFLFGVDERFTITAIANGSPAEHSGFLIKDKIIKAGGIDLGEGKQALKNLGKVFNEHKEGAPVPVVVTRQGELVQLTIHPSKACDYPVEILHDDRVNAFADGKRVIITSGMLRFAESDDDLALIIGHELAHNTRNHMRSKLGNSFIGALLGAVVTAGTGVYMTQAGADIGSAAFSQEFEAEADYIGVYHAARAGYNVKQAAKFWRRMARIHPRGIHLAGSTHPSTAKRFLAVQKAADEVARKRISGQPLVPEEQ